MEMHMFHGTLLKHRSVKGYINKGLVEVGLIKWRHDELAEEMLRRGFNHKSPLNDDGMFYEEIDAGEVDVVANLAELARRCHKCEFLQGVCNGGTERSVEESN